MLSIHNLHPEIVRQTDDFYILFKALKDLSGIDLIIEEIISILCISRYCEQVNGWKLHD